MINLILMEGSEKLFSDTVPVSSVAMTLKVAVQITVRRAREAGKFAGKIHALVPIIVSGDVQQASRPETIVPDNAYVFVVINVEARSTATPVEFWEV